MKVITLTLDQYAIVDDVDYTDLSQHNWCAQYIPHMDTYYAITTIKGKRLYMHREVAKNMGLKLIAPQVVDHINRNTLDNRRNNIRQVTRCESQMNRNRQSNNKSGYKGVSWNSRVCKWKSGITINKKRIHLGYFTDKQDAIRARKEFEDVFSVSS